MKTLYFLASFMLALTIFTACSDDDEQLQPAAVDIPFLDGGFTFDKAVLTPRSTNPDGTFKAGVYLLQSPAGIGQGGLFGLPSDVIELTFPSLPERSVLPDGQYAVGLGQGPQDVGNGYIKDNLTIAFNDLKFITSGTITVGTSGEQRTFTFDVRVVNELNDQYRSSVTGTPLAGSVSVPLEVFE